MPRVHGSKESADTLRFHGSLDRASRPPGGNGGRVDPCTNGVVKACGGV